MLGLRQDLVILTKANEKSVRDKSSSDSNIKSEKNAKETLFIATRRRDIGGCSRRTQLEPITDSKSSCIENASGMTESLTVRSS